MKNMRSKDVSKMMLKDFEDNQTQKDLEETLIITHILTEEDIDDNQKRENLKTLGFKCVKNITNKINSYLFQDFLNEQNNFKALHLELKSRESKQKRILDYVLKQPQHDYEVVLWCDITPKKWFKRIFTKYKFEKVELDVFIRGELNDRYKNLLF